MKNNDLQNITQKIKDRATQTLLKTGSEPMRSGRTISSYSTWDIRRNVIIGGYLTLNNFSFLFFSDSRLCQRRQYNIYYVGFYSYIVFYYVGFYSYIVFYYVGFYSYIVFYYVGFYSYIVFYYVGFYSYIVFYYVGFYSYIVFHYIGFYSYIVFYYVGFYSYIVF